jgi:hypothetical protein
MGWYEHELGWPTAGTTPLSLVTGVRFDVLDVPAQAGFDVLDRFPRTGPVALDGRRMRLLVAAGSAEELPGLLDWLEWHSVPLDLTALGEAGLMPAPAPPFRTVGQGAARDRTWPIWVRPPESRAEVESSLPALTVAGDTDSPAVGLMPLVSALANACHRVRLLRGRLAVPVQPCAFSYASRMDAGTRPRSLTS